METKEKVKEKMKLVDPFILFRQVKRVEIDYIVFDDELLRIDFAASPDLKYQAGWWIQISRDTFIRPVGSTTKLKMVGSKGISLAPAKTYFPGRNSIIRFSLFFPLPPNGTEFIDIIEREFVKDYFNFYGVALTEVFSQPIFITHRGVRLN